MLQQESGGAVPENGSTFWNGDELHSVRWRTIVVIHIKAFVEAPQCGKKATALPEGCRPNSFPLSDKKMTVQKADRESSSQVQKWSFPVVPKGLLGFARVNLSPCFSCGGPFRTCTSKDDMAQCLQLFLSTGSYNKAMWMNSAGNQWSRKTPPVIALNGCSSIGERNRVKCWYDNGSICKWDHLDVPWTAHPTWVFNCMFLWWKGQIREKPPKSILSIALIVQQPNDLRGELDPKVGPFLTCRFYLPVLDDDNVLKRREEEGHNVNAEATLSSQAGLNPSTMLPVSSKAFTEATERTHEFTLVKNDAPCPGEDDIPPPPREGCALSVRGWSVDNGGDGGPVRLDLSQRADSFRSFFDFFYGFTADSLARSGLYLDGNELVCCGCGERRYLEILTIEETHLLRIHAEDCQYQNEILCRCHTENLDGIGADDKEKCVKCRRTLIKKALPGLPALPEYSRQQDSDRAFYALQCVICGRAINWQQNQTACVTCSGITCQQCDMAQNYHGH